MADREGGTVDYCAHAWFYDSDSTTCRGHGKCQKIQCCSQKPSPFGKAFIFWKEQYVVKHDNLIHRPLCSDNISRAHLLISMYSTCLYQILPMSKFSFTSKGLRLNYVELSVLLTTGTHCYFFHPLTEQCRVILGFKAALQNSPKHSSLFETQSHIPVTAILVNEKP